MKQNPRAGDHRVRATLKTFKKNYHEEAFGAAAAAASCRDIHGNLIHGRAYGINLNERIKHLLDENMKQRSLLKEKTYELEALTYKYRKIQGMIQSGQYLQAINAASINQQQQLPGSTGTCTGTGTLTSSANTATTSLTSALKQSQSIATGVVGPNVQLSIPPSCSLNKQRGSSIGLTSSFGVGVGGGGGATGAAKKNHKTSFQMLSSNNDNKASQSSNLMSTLR